MVGGKPMVWDTGDRRYAGGVFALPLVGEGCVHLPKVRFSNLTTVSKMRHPLPLVGRHTLLLPKVMLTHRSPTKGQANTPPAHLLSPASHTSRSYHWYVCPLPLVLPVGRSYHWYVPYQW